MEPLLARPPSSRSSGGSYGSAHTPSRGARSQSSHSNGTARRRPAGSNSGGHIKPASSELSGASTGQRFAPGVWSDASLIRAVGAIGEERNERGAADAAAEASGGQLSRAEGGPHAAEGQGNAPTDQRGEAQGADRRVAPGEEFIVSPSPLAIALASERDGRRLAVSPAMEAASASEVSNRGLSSEQQQSVYGGRRARSLQEARPVRGASETSGGAQQRGGFSERRSVQDGQRVSAPSQSSFSKGCPNTRMAMSDTAATSSQSGMSVTFAPPAALQNQVQQQPVAQLQGSSEGKQDSPAVVHGKVPLPPILRDWATKPDAEAVLSKILTLASAHLRSVDGRAVHFEADDEESLQEAQQDLLRHLGHKASIEEKRKVKEEVERIQQEVREGLRCEFKVPLVALPYVLGPQGSNVAQVQADCGLDRLIASPRDGTVRIAGRRKEDVEKARSLLEFDVRRFPLSRDLCESSGDLLEAVLTKVRTKSKVAAAELRDDEHGLAVLLVGRKAAVEEGARVVTAQLQVLEELQAEAAEVADMSEELQQISRAWGQEGAQAPAPFHAPSSRAMGASRLQQAATPGSAGTPMIAREAGWEDIEPPRVNLEARKMGAHTETSSWAEVPALETAGRGMETNDKRAVSVAAEKASQRLGAHDKEDSLTATGWEGRVEAPAAGESRTGNGHAEAHEVTGDFWTLTSPPAPQKADSHTSAWDAAWPSSAVSGRTQWGQHGRAESRPEDAAHAGASSGQPHFMIALPKTSVVSGRAREERWPVAEDRRVEEGPREVINTRRAAPPDLSTLLRTPSGKPSGAASLPAASAARSHDADLRPTASAHVESHAHPQARGAQHKGPAPVHVTSNEGSRTGRINSNSVPQVASTTTADSRPVCQPLPPEAASVVAPRRVDPASRARSVPGSFPRRDVSRETLSARPARGSLSWAESSVSSTNSTSNSKLAHKEAKSARNLPVGVSQEMLPVESTHEQQGVGSQDSGEHPQEASLPGHEAKGQLEVAREESPRGGGPTFEAHIQDVEDASRDQEGAAQSVDTGSASVESVQGSQAGVAEARAAEMEVPGQLPSEEAAESDEAYAEQAEAVDNEARGEESVPIPDCPAGTHQSEAASQKEERPHAPQRSNLEGQQAQAPPVAPMAPTPRSCAAAQLLLAWSTPLRAEAKVFVAGVGLVDETEPAEGEAVCASKETTEPSEGHLTTPYVAAEGRGDGEGIVVEAGSGAKREEGSLEWAERSGQQHEGKPSDPREQLSVLDNKNRGEEAATGWEHGATANEEATTGWANGHHAHEREAPQAAARESGWKDAPVQHWSDDTPVHAKKATSSGSFISEDSGSVRSVGIDVGQWVEEAAEKTLQEDLDHCPAPFEGASDTRSGRGGSSSSAAGSSEGGRRERARGPYRLKMQKYQLQAIKANQRGGGDPSGWEAVPEEDMGGEARILPTPSLKPEAPPAVPSPTPATPSVERRAEQAPPEWTQHKQRQWQHGPPLAAANTRRSSNDSAHPMPPPAPPAHANPPAAKQEIHAGPAEESGAPVAVVASGTDEVAPTGWAEEVSASEGPSNEHGKFEEKNEQRGAANAGWVEDTAAPGAEGAQHQPPGRGRPDRSASTGESERRKNKRGGRQQREKRERAMAERQAGPPVQPGGVKVLGSGRRAPAQHKLAGRATSGGSERPHGSADAAQPTGWTNASPADAVEEHPSTQQHWSPSSDSVPATGNSGWGDAVSQGRRHVPAAPVVPTIQHQRPGKKAQLPSEAQDIRVVEGVLPPAVLKRSIANAAPLLPTPTGEQRSGPSVQGARFPPERQHEGPKTSRGRDRRRGSREGSPRGVSEQRVVSAAGGQEGAPGGEVSPSKVPPSGWTDAELSPASILHPIEQASPGGRGENSKGRNSDRGRTAGRSNTGKASEGTMTSVGNSAKRASGSGLGQQGAGSCLAGKQWQGISSQGDGTWGQDAVVHAGRGASSTEAKEDITSAEMGRASSNDSGKAKERVARARPSGVWSVRSRHEASVCSS